MTEQEFVDGYCQRSGVTRQWLSGRMVALPCVCPYEGCEGWAMVPHDPRSVELHSLLYGPEQQTPMSA